MRKKDVEKISDVVSAILRMQGLETPLNEARAVNAWSEVVGERVAIIRFFSWKCRRRRCATIFSCSANSL